MPHKSHPKDASKATPSHAAKRKQPTPRAAVPTPEGARAMPDDMPADVVEFITAVDTYKRKHRRPFPSWSEILEIVKSLGYERAG